MHTFTAVFGTTNPNKNVILNSTLLFEEYIYYDSEVKFICVTRGSASIAWRSVEYIGATEDDRVEFASSDVESPRVINFNVEAILVSAKNDGETLILTSELKINVSSDYRTPSVTCIHVDDLSNETLSFKVLACTYLP